MIYIIILGILAMLSIVEYVVDDFGESTCDSIKKFRLVKYTLFWYFIIFFIFFVGLRFYTGLDYARYCWIFQMAGTGIKAGGVEDGYYWLNLLVNSFGGSSQWVFLFMAVGTLILKGLFISKKSEKLYLSLFTYFSMFLLVYDMGQIRSSFAQAFGLIGIMFFIKNKNKLAIVFILLGTLFHTSEIILILIFIFAKREYKLKTLVITYVSALVIGQIMNLSVIDNIVLKLPSSEFTQKLIYYTTNPLFASKVGLSFNVIFDMMILVLIILVRRFIEIKDKNFTIISNIYFIGICIYVLFNHYSVLAIRLSDYFKVLIIVLLPMLLNLIKDKRIKYILLLIFIIIFSVIVARELGVNTAVYLPYKINYFGSICKL